MQNTPELLVNTHDRCGENPLFDERRNLFFWCDIPDGEIYEYNPQTRAHRLVHKGRECGAFTLQEDGQLLLLYVGDAELLNPETGALTPVRSGFVSDTERFNDCIAKPDGSLFAGTVDWTGKLRGGLFDLTHNLDAEKVYSGTACSNGLAFTPDLGGLYYADSTAKKVFLFDFDAQSGQVSNRREWLDCGENTPDGLTIDREGNLWITFFDIGCVRFYSPQAQMLREVKLDAKHVTSCNFGGENFDELYITTAGGKDGDENLNGALFRLKCEIGGKPEFRTQVGL